MKSWSRLVVAAAFICGAMVGCGGDDSSPVTEPVTPVVAVPAVPTSLSVEPGDTVKHRAVVGGRWCDLVHAVLD